GLDGLLPPSKRNFTAHLAVARPDRKFERQARARVLQHHAVNPKVAFGRQRRGAVSSLHSVGAETNVGRIAVTHGNSSCSSRDFNTKAGLRNGDRTTIGHVRITSDHNILVGVTSERNSVTSLDRA